MSAADSAALRNPGFHRNSRRNQKQAVEFERIPISAGIFDRTAVANFCQRDIEILSGEMCPRHEISHTPSVDANLVKIFSRNSK
jgi:hypothetical protein